MNPNFPSNAETFLAEPGIQPADSIRLSQRSFDFGGVKAAGDKQFDIGPGETASVEGDGYEGCGNESDGHEIGSSKTPSLASCVLNKCKRTALLGLLLAYVVSSPHLGLSGPSVVNAESSLSAIEARNLIPTISWLSVQAQEETETSQDEELEKKYRGRLPNYFGLVVNSDQRESIYEIQAKFNRQIAGLQAQIEQLEKERNQAVEQVLTAEQLAEVEKKREEARLKRESRKKKSDQSSQR